MSKGQLDGKVALVTGAGRGIGRAVALTLAREGAVLALASRTVPELRAVQDEIAAAGGTAGIFPTDMADEARIQAMLTGVIETYGRLDILVNNAGVSNSKLIADLTTEEWDQVMDINSRGPFILCREAIPHLRKNTPSFIINMISVGGRTCKSVRGAYAMSKNALRALSIILSEELRETGIRVHAVHPGAVETPMLAKAMERRSDLKGARLLRAQEIADIILFLVTHADGGIIDEVSIRRADAPYYCYP